MKKSTPVPQKKKMKLNKLTYVAISTAAVAVLSQIIVPLPFTPVPINLAVLGVLVAGGFLGSYMGALSMVLYMLLGCIGIPVFAGLASGAGILVGPTGGYVVGYIFAAYIAGMAGTIGKNSKIGFVLTLVVAVLACYALGTVWFVFTTGTGVWESLIMCVFPFIAGDGIKIAIAVPVIKRLVKAIK